MEHTINYPEFIERYLDGEMSPEEKTWFEKEIEDNPELGDEIQLRREVNEAIMEEDVIQLRMQLDSIHRKHQAEKIRAVRRRPALRRVVLAASSAAVLTVFILLGGRYWWGNVAPEKIFHRYYEPYEMPVYREAGTATDLLFLKAMETYQNREFDRAIELFEEVLALDGTKMDASLMSGISKIETERYGEATTNFRRIIEHRDNMFMDQAEWYLALSYLMKGETGKATALFEQIAGEEGTYRKEAREILRKIR
ncbi:MAG: hypothetical protein ACP5D1_08910 [Bacteroidales bacterium]